MMGMTDTFAVIDFETTGLSPQQGDRAIEIGVAVFDGDRVIDTYQSLMNPGVEVPYFIEELTGISQEMVEDSPASTTVMREVRAIIGDLPIVAHNASFDRNFYVAELEKIGRYHDDPVSLHHVDRPAALPRVHRIINSPRWRPGITSIRQGHHRALADAVMTSKLLAVMRKDLMGLYDNQAIDSQFLHGYQKKSKNSVRSCG